MQTITVKYLSVTNTKGARIKATQSEGKTSVTLSRDYGLNFEEQAMDAAKAICKKLGWSGTMQGGHTKEGMVFVFANGMYRFKVASKQKEKNNGASKNNSLNRQRVHHI